MKKMKLKELRLEKGYTMQQMADLLDISQPGYSQIENENYMINIDMLVRLAEILECTTDEILDFDLKAVLERNKETYTKLLEQAKK